MKCCLVGTKTRSSAKGVEDRYGTMLEKWLNLKELHVKSASKTGAV
jgi:hypothetical protein